jgi:hypothetical protein
MICPDAIFGLRLVRTDAATLTSYFFLEIDRGTMTIVPTRHIRETDAFLHRATMLRKLMTYAESWRLGLHRERFAVHSARVLTISNGAARAKSVRELMRGLVCGEGDLPSGLFVFGTADQGVNALVDAAGNQAVVLSSLPQYQ